MGFYIDADVAGDLQILTAQLKAKAQAAGQLLPTQSEIVEAALALARDHPGLRHKLQILLARGLRANTRWTKRAEQVLRTIVGENSKNVAAWFELGLLYKEAGFPSRAERAFTKVVELVPGHRAASAELAAGAPEPPKEGGRRWSLHLGGRDQ